MAKIGEILNEKGYIFKNGKDGIVSVGQKKKAPSPAKAKFGKVPYCLLKAHFRKVDAQAREQMRLAALEHGADYIFKDVNPTFEFKKGVLSFIPKGTKKKSA